MFLVDDGDVAARVRAVVPIERTHRFERVGESRFRRESGLATGKRVVTTR